MKYFNSKFWILGPLLIFSIDKVSFCQSKFKSKATPKASDKILEWNFPIQRCHAGVPMGNGKQGFLIWGSDSRLNITIAHAGFWDRRGGVELDSNLVYSNLKKLLLNKDEAELKRIFGLDRIPKSNIKPRQFGGCLIQIPLPKGYKLKLATLNMTRGECQITIERKGMPKHTLTIIQHAESNIATISWPLLIPKPGDPILIAAADFLTKEYAELQIPKPEYWRSTVSKFELKGIIQKLPADDLLGIACTTIDRTTLMATGWQRTLLPTKLLLLTLTKKQVNSATLSKSHLLLPAQISLSAMNSHPIIRNCMLDNGKDLISFNSTLL